MYTLVSSQRIVLVVVAVLCSLTACRGDDATQSNPSDGNPPIIQSTPTTGAAGPSTQPAEFGLVLDRITAGFAQPVFLTHAGDGTNRLFVVEREGTIRILRGAIVETEPFLNVASLITARGGEQGLLGLAFHPRYRQNGRFFIYFTATNGNNTVQEFRVSSNPDRAESTPRATLISVQDFAPNHNGGMLAFGRDGYLYVGLGDGGGAGDPQRTAQDRQALLGKILRLDVDGGQPYVSPRDNPFVGRSDARPEVWSFGWRNPWRFSFDRQTGDLWVGDVGQNAIEEVSFQPGNSRGGENYGWSIVEGTACFRPTSGCSTDGLVGPVVEYDHSGGRCAVIGGYVYRGSQFPQMNGAYFYADECSGEIWSLGRDLSGSWKSTELMKSDLMISSFGEDEAGEIYALDLRRGAVFRLALAPR